MRKYCQCVPDFSVWLVKWTNQMNTNAEIFYLALSRNPYYRRKLSLFWARLGLCISRKRNDYVGMIQMRVDYCVCNSQCQKRTASCKFILIKKRNCKIGGFSYSSSLIGLQGKQNGWSGNNLVSAKIFTFLGWFRLAHDRETGP